MPRIIISDTSCLILLEKIGELDLLLHLYGTITTTKEVVNEYGIPLPPWIVIRQPTDNRYQKIIEVSLDKGEASAIALAVEYEDSLLIIDELKGRKFAQQLGLSVIGTIGIIVDTKISGLIHSIKPLLEKIRNTNFRVSSQLELAALKKSGEI